MPNPFEEAKVCVSLAEGAAGLVKGAPFDALSLLSEGAGEVAGALNKLKGGSDLTPAAGIATKEVDLLHEYLIEHGYLMDAFKATGRNPMGFHMDMVLERERLIREYGFSLLDESALSKLINEGRNSPLVDYGAGNGYLSYILRGHGVDVVPIDVAPPELGGNVDFPATAKAWTKVEKGDVDALANYPNRTLMLASPPPDEPMAADALARYSGNRLIYIGEGRGGYTGDDRFFDMLENDWQLEHKQNLPNFPSIPRVWPELRIYQRKPV